MTVSFIVKMENILVFGVTVKKMINLMASGDPGKVLLKELGTLT